MRRNPLSAIRTLCLILPPGLLAVVGLIALLALTSSDSLAAQSSTPAAGKGNRVSGEDITLHSDNDNPWGIWSDGVTMWVLDRSDKKLYAYNLKTKARDSDKDRTLPSISQLAGFFVLGSNLYLVNDPEHLSNRSIWICSGFFGSKISCPTSIGPVDSHGSGPGKHSHPQGVWANSSNLYVSDRGGGSITDHSGAKLYAYYLQGSVHPSRHFSGMEDDGMEHIVGIWSDNVTMWAADKDADKVFAYKLSDRSRDSSKDFPLTDENGDARGVWSDSVHMWVANPHDDKVYAYDISKMTAGTDDRAGGNDNPLGLWAGSKGVMVGDSTDKKIYHYSNENLHPQPRFDSSAQSIVVHALGGHWYERSTDILFVADGSRRIIHGYKYNNGAPAWTATYANGIALARENGSPVGIWSDGSLIWVVDGAASKVFAYEKRNSATPRRVPSRDITLPSFMNSPKGIYSDGVILWVGNDAPSGSRDRLHAFRLDNGQRTPLKDVSLSAYNHAPSGIASRDGGEKLLVVNGGGSDRGFFEYAVPKVPVLNMSVSLLRQRSGRLYEETDDPITEGETDRAVTITVTLSELSGGRFPDPLDVTIVAAHGSAAITPGTVGGNPDVRFRPSATVRGQVIRIAELDFHPKDGSGTSATSLQILPIDDDLVEGTEHIVIGAEIGEWDGNITRYEDLEILEIHDNDAAPCGTLPLTQQAANTMAGGAAATEEHVGELNSRYDSGQGVYRGDFSDRCYSSFRDPDIPRGYYHESYQFRIVDSPKRVRIVMHSDIDENACTRQGKCREVFDPYLVLLKTGWQGGLDHPETKVLARNDDIDIDDGNHSAGIVMELEPGYYIIHATTYSTGVRGGFTLEFNMEPTDEDGLAPLPGRREGVVWAPPNDPVVSITAPPTDAVGDDCGTWTSSGAAPHHARILTITEDGERLVECGEINEGRAAVFTVNLDHERLYDLEVEVEISDVSGSNFLHRNVEGCHIATIPAGDSWVKVGVPTRNDRNRERGGAITATIRPWNDYNVSGIGARVLVSDDDPTGGTGNAPSRAPQCREDVVYSHSLDPVASAVPTDPTKLELSWNAIQGAKQYRIKGITRNAIVVNETAYTLTHLDPSTAYAATIEAWTGPNPTGRRLTHSRVEGTTADPIAMSVTATPALQDADTGIRISWQPVAAARSYVVRWKGPYDVRWSDEALEPDDQGVLDAHLDVTGLQPNTAYQVQVWARSQGSSDIIGRGSASTKTFRTTPAITVGYGGGGPYVRLERPYVTDYQGSAQWDAELRIDDSAIWQPLTALNNCIFVAGQPESDSTDPCVVDYSSVIRTSTGHTPVPTSQYHFRITPFSVINGVNHFGNSREASTRPQVANFLAVTDAQRIGPNGAMTIELSWDPAPTGSPRYYVDYRRVSDPGPWQLHLDEFWNGVALPMDWLDDRKLYEVLFADIRSSRTHIYRYVHGGEIPWFADVSNPLSWSKYVVSWRVAATPGPWIGPARSSKSDEHTIGGLSPDTVYDVRLTQRDANTDEVQARSVRRVRTFALFERFSVHRIPGDTDSLLVRWKPFGTRQTGHLELRWYLASDGSFVGFDNVDTDTGRYVIDDLEPNTRYTVRATPFYDLPDGTPVNGLSVEDGAATDAPPPPEPEAPEKVKKTSDGLTLNAVVTPGVGIEFSWAGIPDIGGERVTSYSIFVQREGGGWEFTSWRGATTGFVCKAFMPTMADDGRMLLSMDSDGNPVGIPPACSFPFGPAGLSPGDVRNFQLIAYSPAGNKAGPALEITVK